MMGSRRLLREEEGRKKEHNDDKVDSRHIN